MEVLFPKCAGLLVSAGELSFCEADLLRDEGWDAAANGCTFVVHVASPMGQGLPEAADLLGPAREGSLQVLRPQERA